MREIEIKAKVVDANALRKLLEDKGIELSVPMEHHDVVWGVLGNVRGDDSPWLRLRTETKGDVTRYLFTLKRSMTGQLDSLEYETEVDTPDAVIGMVRELGFVPYSDITKTRQKAHMGDIELCLDSVDTLGEFIEAERLTDESADYQTVENELWRVFEEFGIARDSEVTEGYDVMINKLLGKE